MKRTPPVKVPWEIWIRITTAVALPPDTSIENVARRVEFLAEENFRIRREKGKR